MRCAALQCLRLLPAKLRYDQIHPVRSRVLEALAYSIADDKKAVRKEAVYTRAKWFTAHEAE